MNGAGNRFVILDGRKGDVRLTPEQIRALASPSNAQTGGCDQVIVIENPSSVIRHSASVFMRIYNADGGESSACGNATRCVAWLVMEETKQDAAAVETKAGVLACTRAGEKRVRVNMGKPRFAPAEIPVAAGVDIENIALEGMSGGRAVGMGNPHAVFFVPDAAAADVAALGPRIETRTDVFPERVNVGFAQIVSPREIRLRVWERGAGETLACGTGACAAMVAAARRGLTGNEADVVLPGGTLRIAWEEGGPVFMEGAMELESQGEMEI